MPDMKMKLVDWLDDLCVRFVINLPQEELESVERICFQVEEAQWFYEDFIRPLDPSLPSMPLRTFCLQMFRHCPLLASFSEYHHLLAFEEFLAYKTRVPVRGAILLNHDMDEVLLVRGWKKGANWSFPRGKINKDEKDIDCAVREVYEETGYDIKAAGLVGDEANAKYIQVTMREQHMKLYVFRGVPTDTFFQPRTRKEISKIQWYKLSQLPGYRKTKHTNGPDEQDVIKANKFYMVAPFLQSLKKWISHQRKIESRHRHAPSYSDAYPTTDAQDFDDYLTEDNNEMQRQFEQARQEHRLNLAQQQQPSRLNQSLLQQDPLPGIDAATELKRLLSVGASNDFPSQAPPLPPPTTTTTKTTTAPAATGNTAQLLAMLRGSSNTPTQLQQQTHPGQQTPYQQPQLAEMAASIVRSESQRATGGQSFDHAATSLPTTPPFNGTGSFAPIQARRSSRQNSLQPVPQQTALQQSMEDQTQRSAQQALAPYQRTGDPQFARDVSLSAQQGPSIPAASDLPAPNLSNHALNLLNAFKSRGLAPAPKPAPAEMAVSSSHQGFDPSKAQLRPALDQLAPGSKPSHQHSESRSRQALSQTLPRSNPLEQPDLANLASSQPVTQKHALLELFKRPSQPSSPVEMPSNQPGSSLADLLQGPLSVQSDQKPRLAGPVSSKLTKQPISAQEPSPVELAAAPSPGPQPHKKQLFDHKDGMMKDHKPQLRVLNRPSNSNRSSRDLNHPPHTSATVSGPLHNPEFGGSQRKSRSSKGKESSTTNPNSEQKQLTQSPIQILKRPTTPRETVPAKAEAWPAKSPLPRQSENVTSQATRERISPPELKAAQTKPFQPQILRRPPQSPALSEAVHPTSQAPSNLQDNDVSELSVATPNEPRAPSLPKPETYAPRHSAQPSSSPPTDKKSSNTDEQKQTLLSLFAKSKSPALSLSSDPTAVTRTSSALEKSNVSKPDSKSGTPFPSLNPLLSQISTYESTSEARVSESGTTWTENAPLNDPPRRDSQTPMSPDDKGFLLNYLQGFAKGRGR